MELGWIGTIGIMISGWFLIQYILIPGVPRIYRRIKAKVVG